MDRDLAYLIHNHEPDTSTPDMSAAPPPLTDECQIGFGPYKYMRLGDVPVSFFVWMVKEHNEYPRASRPLQWIRVIEWLRSKRRD